ncbi:hypothetical protein J4476_03620, partial [Candidatus Woesearchaeota archaeon]|nr:hypothetical protein [Candidatus Woesearchaeota archaeon]
MLKKEYMIIVSVIILFLLLQKNVSADFPSCPGDTTDGIWVITDRQIITGNTVCYNITIKSGGKLLVQNGAIISSINITLGNLSVEYGGEINATGFGYIGSSSTATGPGAGISRRAGGSYGGRGGAAQETNIGNVYGDPLRPTDLGSGGSGSGTTSGAGGGGSILINVTQNFILNGAVIANGNNTISGSNLGAGSGGSILLYTYNLTGTGNLSARGGKSASSSGGGGGGGRIAVYYNHTTLNFSRSTAEGSKDDAGFQGSTGTFIAVNQIYNNATIYAWNWNSSVTLSSFSNITFVSANTTIDNNDIIKIDNRFYFDGQSYFNCRTNISKQITVSEIETGNISSYLSNFKNECGMTNVTINTSSNIIISNNNLLNFSILNFDNSSVDIEIINSRITSNINFTIRNITIDTLSWINSSGKGYSGGIASGLGPGGPIRGGTGASYGGRGMSATHTNDINVYGNPLKPTALGSGGSGSGSTRGGTGGGFIYINATNNLILNGMLKSDGTESFGGLGGSGGGSGGSILLYSYNLTGTGNISAIGGPGFNIVSSGGRIAVYYNHTTLNFSRSTAEGTKTSISGTLPLVSASGTFIAVNQIYNNATIYAWNWNSSVDLSIYSNIT